MKQYRRILFFSLFFMSGFTIMVFELLGSLILAPYVGNSLLTWTSVIGVILFTLGIGYYVGGQLSHKNYLSLIFIATLVSFLYVVFFKEPILSFIQNLEGVSHIVKIILSSTLLFVPSSFCMALATPFLAKRSIETAPDIGERMGFLYTLSSFGSIVGTFMTGFMLIPFFGINTLLLGMACMYGFLALFFLQKKSIGLVILGITLLLAYFFPVSYADTNLIFSQQTAYGLLQVKEVMVDNEQVRRLYSDNLVQSQIFVDNPLKNLTSTYSHYYQIADFLNPELQTTLMIGGGAYAYPQYFLAHNPTSTMDVVEINPEITDIAKKYFGLVDSDSDGLHIYHQDGRVFLNETEKRYDAIYIDAFHGFSIPTHLTTVEFVESLHDHLNEYGVVIVNIPGFIQGAESEFVRAEYKTYKEQFEYVDVYPVTHNPHQFQNIMLVAQKKRSLKPVAWKEPYAEIINHRWREDIPIDDIPIFTDDYAPVNFYTRSYSRFY
jgi:spermidine synthase